MLTEAMLAATMAMAPGVAAEPVEQAELDVQQEAIVEVLEEASVQTDDASEAVLAVGETAADEAAAAVEKAAAEEAADADEKAVADEATDAASADAAALTAAESTGETAASQESANLAAATAAAVADDASVEEADVVFEFSDTGITAAGESSGYKVSGTDLTITAAGTYLVTGSCEDGSITVKKAVTDVVLILKGLALANTDGAALTLNKTSEATVEVVGDVVLTDAEDPADEESEDAAVADAFEGAVIKAKSGSSLTITGTGTLTLDGSECKNGIKGASEATVTIGADAGDAVTVVVKAANNGVACDNAVVVNGGKLAVEAGNDGIKAEVDEDDEASAGTITINGGEIDIVLASGDGIQATGDIVVNGGDVYVKALEDGMTSAANVVVNGGEITIVSTRDGMQADADLTVNGGTIRIVANGGSATKLSDDADSCKGLKAENRLTIAGGSVTIDSADDAVHCDGSISILDGTLVLASGDDGVHADSTLDIGSQGADGPTITISKSYEGLEGANINLYSGVVDITASDDGVNAANKDLGTAYAFSLNIYGGTLRVNAGGDGLDSNGTITMTGGNLEVFGSADNGNAAMDYGDRNGSWTQSGGSIIAVGMSGMAIVPSSGTYVSFGSSGMGAGPMGGGMGGGFGRGFAGTVGAIGGSFSITSGSSIVIKDGSGNVVYSTTGAKNANSVVFSSDDLVTGQAYTLYVNGSAVATATATTGNGQDGGGMGGQPGGMGGIQPGMSGGQQGGMGNQPGSMGGIQSGMNGDQGSSSQPTLPNGSQGETGRTPEFGQGGGSQQPGQFGQDGFGQMSQPGQERGDRQFGQPGGMQQPTQPKLPTDNGFDRGFAGQPDGRMGDFGQFDDQPQPIAQQPGAQPEMRQPGDQPEMQQPGAQPDARQPEERQSETKQFEGRQPVIQPSAQQPTVQPSAQQPSAQPEAQKPAVQEPSLRQGRANADQDAAIEPIAFEGERQALQPVNQPVEAQRETLLESKISQLLRAIGEQIEAMTSNAGQQQLPDGSQATQPQQLPFLQMVKAFMAAILSVIR